MNKYIVNSGTKILLNLMLIGFTVENCTRSDSCNRLKKVAN